MKRAALCGNRTWCFQPPSRGFYPKRGGEVGEGSKEVQLGACPRYGAHRAQPSSTRGPGAMRDQNWGDEGTRAAQGLSVRGRAALHKCLLAAGGRQQGSGSSI